MRNNTDNDVSVSRGFAAIRNVFWPIEVHEYKRVLPMGMMLFCILLNYSTLRSIKDGLVVTHIGAEAIGFLKTYLVLPLAVMATLAYVKLCNVLKQEKVFYVITGFFILYFVLFSFAYAKPDWVHPDASTISAWSSAYPYLQWPIRIMGKWSFATFYVMAELWGSMILSLLFWQFANQITKTEEAKRFYATIAMLGNVALLVTPLMGKLKSKSFIGVMSIMILSAILIMLLYSWMRNNVLTDPGLAKSKVTKKSKAKLSLGESLRVILTSKYLGLIALLSLTYGISMNLVEGVWKAKLRELYPGENDYTTYMTQFQGWQGFSSILFMLVGNNILRKTSWLTTAMVTPLMVLVTGIAFFAFVLFSDSMAAFLMVAPLAAAAMVGMIQNVLSKATKYSLFDATKNMAYIPLDDELRAKGQAAVEVIGGRFGKSGGGFIQSTAFTLFPALTFSEFIPYFASIFFVMVLVWIYAVKTLNKAYKALLETRKQ